MKKNILFIIFTLFSYCLLAQSTNSEPKCGNCTYVKSTSKTAPTDDLELIKTISALNERISELENLVYQLVDKEESNEGQVGILELRASSQQNQPNPFKENTKIKYFIPEKIKNAKMQITTIDGKIINTFTLQQGKHFMTLNAEQLPAGSYIYTLITDGQIVESKRMVITK